MSKTSDELNKNNVLNDFTCSGDPHWCSVNVTNRSPVEKKVDNKFANAKLTIDTTEFEHTVSNIMKNVDHPSQVINQEINRPSHYGSKSGKDVIDWCEDFGIMNNAYIFNIFKYLCRAGKKNNNSELQDALKARIYLDRYIEKLENGNCL